MACFGPTVIYEDFDNALLRLRQPSWGLPPVTPIEAFWVTMANGERLDFREKYEGVRLFVQGLEFATTLFSLPLNGLDKVLGIQWPEKLGPVMSD